MSRKFVIRCGATVLSGPFKGMKYTQHSAISHYSTPNLLGTYEMELHPYFEALSPKSYERLVDIGSAEGYYAVGMAMRTQTPVDAFEVEQHSRKACREMAELNGVSQLVHIHSWCSPSSLLKLAGKRCFVLSDCEGYELSLFTPEVIRSLAKSDLIVELHDGTSPSGTTRTILQSRFVDTHKLKIVKFKPRELEAYPEFAFLQFLGRDAIRAISEEGRGTDQEWLIATAVSRT